MIGLAAAAILLASTAVPAPVAAPASAGPLSVAVQASGGQDVSYAIVVRNTADHAVPDAVITQQLPPSMDYVAATPVPQRTGHHLSWTLTIPAHGTARITTTGAAGHHLGARPLDHVTQAGTLHHGHHRQLMTTVCVREDTGPQACATGRGALRPESLSRWEHGALAIGSFAAVLAACFGGVRIWRRRRVVGALERAGVG
jgi:uncharacterized repeat protein (TIGR01451 family)